MNPEAGRWIMQCSGQDVGPATKQHTLGLIHTLQLLGILRDDMQIRHHDAAYDARMTRLIYVALLVRAKPHAAESQDLLREQAGAPRVRSSGARTV